MRYHLKTSLLIGFVICLSGCFPRPGYTDREAMVLYFEHAYRDFRLEGGSVAKDATAQQVVSAMQAAGQLLSDRYNRSYIGEDGVPKDIWGRPLVFNYEGVVIGESAGNVHRAHFYSMGPNGQFDNLGEDDYPSRDRENWYW